MWVNNRGCMVLAVAAAWAGSVARLDAGLIVYATRAAFDAANPGLPVEGFENTSAGTTAFTGPLNSATNNAVFSTGSILPGITFVDNPGPGINGMFLAGPGQSSNPTRAIGQNTPATDALDILFDGPGVAAVAFDVFQNFGFGSQSGQTQDYPVQIFGASGLLGTINVSVPSGAAGFFGVSSDTELITRVSINRTDAFEVIDNVAFGGTLSVSPIPEPPSLAVWGVVALGLAAGRLRVPCHFRTAGRRWLRRALPGGKSAD